MKITIDFECSTCYERLPLLNPEFDFDNTLQSCLKISGFDLLGLDKNPNKYVWISKTGWEFIIYELEEPVLLCPNHAIYKK